MQQQQRAAAHGRATPMALGAPRIGIPALPRRVARHAAAELAPSPLATVSQRSMDEEEKRAFPYPLPYTSAQKSLSSIPLPLFYPAILAAIGGAGLAGNIVGQSLPVEEDNKEVAGYAAAAVCAAGIAFAGVQAKKVRDSAAVVDLYNLIVDLPEPTDLTPDMVLGVGSKYGTNMQKDDLEGLCKIYGQFLESVIPSGDTQLKGGEAEQVKAFKEALGLSDEDAAPVHIEVARRLFRQGYETGDRQQQFEQRKAFARLIYVSALVFGEQKAAFLLPWRRHFNLTEAQLFVARRDNAKTIFKQYMESRGGELPAERHVLRELRDQQQVVKMMDETAEELVKEYSRRHVEAKLNKALEAVRAQAKRDSDAMLREVQDVLDYSRKLAGFANEEDLIPGLGAVTVAGGPLGDPAKTRDLKDLFRTYLEEQVQRSGEFTAALDADAHDLAAVLALPQKDAQMLQDEVAAKLYKRLLREEVVSRRIDAASSPAQVLSDLCDRVRFSPEAAFELHRQLYKQKLTTLMDKKTISEEDNEELKRIRRILCLTPDVVAKVSRETVGKVLEEVIGDIYLMGARPLAEADGQRVDQVIKDMRIEPDVALEVYAKATRDRMKVYVQQAQKEKNQDRKAFCAALKKLVTFNALAASPLLDRIKGMDAAKKELADTMMKALEMAKKEGATPEEIEKIAEEAAAKSREEQLKQVKESIKANRGEYTDEERKGQKEITLRDEVDGPNRAELYKTYLMTSMMADVVELPVGGTIRKKQNPQAQQAEMARLQSLSEILGMNQVEVSQVHADLSEQAYKNQASDLMKTGPMTQEKSQYLEQLRGQLGLPKEQADKALKAVRTELFGASAATLDDGGRWTLDRALEIAKAGGSIDGLVEEPTRRNIFRRELEKRITDGTGTLDAEFMLHEVPKVLALDQRKVDSVVKELVATRKRLLLVQAVSTWRQKRGTEVVTSLNNLVSCSRALPDDKAMAWSEREELREVYAAYCVAERDEAKQDQLAKVLGIGEEEALVLRTEGVPGKKEAEARREEEEAFF